MNKSNNLSLALVRLFVVLAETGTTTQSGKVLFLSQSAISHNLKKLRAALDDDLFIRDGNKMVMTSKAIELYPRLKAWLLELEEIVSPAIFRPEETEETFSIACSDLFEQMFGPELLTKFQEAAPKAKLKFIKIDANRLAEDLNRQVCDIAISVRSPSDKNIESRVLYTDNYASCVRADHPLLNTQKSLDDYLRYPHILSSLNDGIKSVVDRKLEEIGRTRELKYVTFNFSNVPYFIAKSDAVWSAPSRYVQFCCEHHNIEMFDTPLDIEPLSIKMFWPKRASTSPANEWLREVIVSITKR
ncbi:LysR family transcriptional regulator [Vibrio fortis]|uniref:LysR family transcriptional regulator n=1 Tax=Vibrio fortis TaxID=212667 RepID=A0A5N3QTL7_9VIBR|nr:LysR family transcriptional regulator [Vibrio fortis]KAB0285518.1 LysR family transcriptional regulator [Vibrio fortis]